MYLVAICMTSRAAVWKFVFLPFLPSDLFRSPSVCSHLWQWKSSGDSDRSYWWAHFALPEILRGSTEAACGWILRCGRPEIPCRILPVLFGRSFLRIPFCADWKLNSMFLKFEWSFAFTVDEVEIFLTTHSTSKECNISQD